MNTTPRTIKIGDGIIHGSVIDWEKRDWKRIYTPEEEMERTTKMLSLNGGPDYDPTTTTKKLLAAASSMKKKPTIRIKRLVGSGKLQAGSAIQGQIHQWKLDQEREKAEKALRLNSY